MKTRMLLGLCVSVLCTLLYGAPTKPPAPPVNHDFDFWIGDWNVTDLRGHLLGTSRVESIAAGHGLLENWTGAPESGGGSGKSLNAYNPAKQQWQQFWVGAGGAVLELAGGLDANGRMVLTGETTTPTNTAVRNRITWTPNADGTVLQVWEQSKDRGTAWQTVFEGIYRKAPAAR